MLLPRAAEGGELHAVGCRGSGILDTLGILGLEMWPCHIVATLEAIDMKEEK